MLSGTLVTASGIARWWCTDRHGGVSAAPFASNNLAAHVGDDVAAVRANRLALEQTIGDAAIAWMGPVHGTRVVELDAPAAITPDVDALATRTRALPLATLAADCVPLLLAADDMIVAAHVGWRGLVAGMTDALIATLADHGIAPTAAQVVLGPSICGACYGIPAERAAAINAACPAALVTAANGGPGADIRRGLAHEWQEVGATVHIVGPCTAESAEHFSHRRDGVTGRQAGVIVWE